MAESDNITPVVLAKAIIPVEADLTVIERQLDEMRQKITEGIGSAVAEAVRPFEELDTGKIESTTRAQQDTNAEISALVAIVNVQSDDIREIRESLTRIVDWIESQTSIPGGS